jgi:hypothetical protein
MNDALALGNASFARVRGTVLEAQEVWAQRRPRSGEMDWDLVVISFSANRAFSSNGILRQMQKAARRSDLAFLRF